MKEVQVPFRSIVQFGLQYLSHPALFLFLHMSLHLHVDDQCVVLLQSFVCSDSATNSGLDSDLDLELGLDLCAPTIFDQLWKIFCCIIQSLTIRTCCAWVQIIPCLVP
jgi:hypothetical protein